MNLGETITEERRERLMAIDAEMMWRFGHYRKFVCDQCEWTYCGAAANPQCPEHGNKFFREIPRPPKEEHSEEDVDCVVYQCSTPRCENQVPSFTQKYCLPCQERRRAREQLGLLQAEELVARCEARERQGGDLQFGCADKTCESTVQSIQMRFCNKCAGERRLPVVSEKAYFGESPPARSLMWKMLELSSTTVYSFDVIQMAVEVLLDSTGLAMTEVEGMLEEFLKSCTRDNIVPAKAAIYLSRVHKEFLEGTSETPVPKQIYWFCKTCGWYCQANRVAGTLGNPSKCSEHGTENVIVVTDEEIPKELERITNRRKGLGIWLDTLTKEDWLKCLGKTEEEMLQPHPPPPGLLPVFSYRCSRCGWTSGIYAVEPEKIPECPLPGHGALWMERKDHPTIAPPSSLAFLEPPINLGHVQPGDTIVFTLKERAPRGIFENLRKQVEEKFPENRVVSLRHDADLYVLGKEDPAMKEAIKLMRKFSPSEVMQLFNHGIQLLGSVVERLDTIEQLLQKQVDHTVPIVQFQYGHRLQRDEKLTIFGTKDGYYCLGCGLYLGGSPYKCPNCGYDGDIEKSTSQPVTEEEKQDASEERKSS